MTLKETATGIRANGEIEYEILKPLDPLEDNKIYIEQIRLVWNIWARIILEQEEDQLADT